MTTETPVFYGGSRVTVANVASRWNGRVGIVLRWVHDNWYIVLVGDTELVLDTSRGEMTRFSV